MAQQFIKWRRKVRTRVRSKTSLDTRLHLFVTGVLITNIVVILYALISISVRLTQTGLDFIDSLPIALYILPLMIILPMLARGYYRERSALVNFIILVLTTAIFAVLSVLIHGFSLFLVLNITALVIAFFMGRFRPKRSIRKISPWSAVWFMFFNVLGMLFPYTTITMGANPIAVVTSTGQATIYFDVPIGVEHELLENLTPSASSIMDLDSNSFGMNLRVLEGSIDPLLNLEEWLLVLNESSVPYIVTLSPNYTKIENEFLTSSVTSDLLERVYESHSEAFRDLTELISSNNITTLPQEVCFDMTLSDSNWEMIMDKMRSIDLVGFESILRSSVEAIDSAVITNLVEHLVTDVH
ncbi:MAG: hypothetical protein ACFE7R_10530, partial [Candidatus Hodarchaeota archaeon]